MKWSGSVCCFKEMELDADGGGWVRDNLPTETSHFRFRNELAGLHLPFAHKYSFFVLKASEIKIRPRCDLNSFRSPDIWSSPDVAYYSRQRIVFRAPLHHPVAPLKPFLELCADETVRRWWNGEN